MTRLQCHPLLVSFILLSSLCATGLSRAEQPQDARANISTFAPYSGTLIEGGEPPVAPETKVYESEAPTSTSTQSTDGSSTTARAPTSPQARIEATTPAAGPSTTGSTVAPTTTAAIPETEDPEPITRVATDTIGVNSDETFSTIDHGLASEDESSSDGIESKSISHAHADATGENSVAKEESGEEHSGKLTAEDSEGEGTEATTGGYKKPNTPYHLNMTEIDQIYARGLAKDDQETAESWHKMNKKLKKGISGVIGALVPYALNMSQEAKIGSNCSGAMLKWVLSMNQLKAWSLRMLDASGKPIAGLLEGSMTMFGNYRQCLKVRAPDDDEIEFAGEFREYFRGKYCIIQIKPWLPQKDRFYNLNTKLNSLTSEEENQWYDRTIFEELSEWLLAFNFVNIRYDICVPSVCSREDIQKAVNYLLKGIDMKARVARCETDRPDGAFGVAAQVESGSQEVAEALAAAATVSTTDETSTTTSALEGKTRLGQFSQLGWILIPAIAVMLVIIATGLSLTIPEDSSRRTSKLKHTIKSLSLKRSLSSHLNINYGLLADDKPLALYGVRFLLVLWVVLVESAVNLKFEYLRELMMLKDLIFWWPMQFIINSTMQYDSFILLTAFTMGYKNCLNDGIDNAKAMSRYVIDKYIRLMPSIMVMVAMVILLPLVYRGPVWTDYVAKQSAVCQSTGWVNTIFLQNYLPFDQICLPQTWLLCVELQLLLIMAPVVYCLNRSYTSKFGTANKSMGGGNGVMQRKALVKSTGRRDDSSKAFHWLWTAPGTFLVACIALGLGSSFYNVYHNELPPSWFYTMADPDSKALYFGEHMTKIWTHLAVFAMGILAGVECRRATKNVYRRYKGSNIMFMDHTNTLLNNHKSQSSSVTSLPIISGQEGILGDGITPASSKISSSDWNHSSVTINILNCNNSNGSSGSHEDGLHSPSLAGGSEIGCINNENVAKSRGGFCSALVDVMGFILVITIMSAVIFSTHEWSLNDLPKPLVAGLFDAGSRFLWSLAMIWILYMISVPNKDRSFSFVAQALGHPAMVFLGKLSFLIYIIHPFVHTTVLAIQEQPIYSSWLMMVHILIGNMTITVALASMISLFVEMPCRNLFRRCGTSLLLTQSTPSSGVSATSTNAS